VLGTESCLVEDAEGPLEEGELDRARAWGTQLARLLAGAAVMGAWFAIVFSGRYPRGIFDYVEGVIRWHNRVVGYALILVTDQYPPFRLRP